MAEIPFDTQLFDSYEYSTELNDQLMKFDVENSSPSTLLTSTLYEIIVNNTLPIEYTISYIPSIGPKRDSLYVAIPLTIIYTIIFLTGMVGNISTCIVISRNKSMHTATNYYLFSLAVSDLLLLVTGLPQEVYLMWSRYPYIFGEFFCVVRGLAAETSSGATVLTITAFTVERYVAICHPFLSHTMSKLSRAIKLILIIWLLSFLAAIPIALQFSVTNEFSVPLCLQTRVIIKHNFVLSTVLFFVTPMTLITVLYILIGLRLRHSNLMKKESSTSYQSASYTTATATATTNTRSGPNSCRHQGQSSRRVLKMLVAVVVAFFVCWAPFHIQRLVATYVQSDDSHNVTNYYGEKQPELQIYEVVTHISGVLYYVSTTTNPLLYHIMSNKFRNAFKETFSRCCSGMTGNAARRRAQRSYSALSQRAAEGGGVRGLRCGIIGNETSTDCSGNSANSAGVQPQYSTKQSSLLSHHPSGPRSNSISSIQANCITSSPISDMPNTNRDQTDPIRVTMVPSTDNEKHVIRIHPTRGIIVGVSQPSTSHKILRFFRCIVQRHTIDERICYMPPLEIETTPLEMKQRGSFSISPCHISNSSLRDIENGALEDELTIYMQEIQRRDRENFYLNR